jgi:putative transposase
MPRATDVKQWVAAYGENPDVDTLSSRGSLKTTLASTNPCESMIECVRRTSRNVKRWQSGDMALRWTAAGMLEAERQFPRIIGYRDLAKLALAIERDLARTTTPSPTEEADAAQRRAPVVPFAPANLGGDRGG